MKVIGIAASPRKGGNTDTMLEQFLKGANSTGAETEKIYIYDKHIEFCQGCQMLCSFSDDVCPRFEGKDDVESIHQKWIDSDLIVIAAPVYTGTPPAKLMALFERSIGLKTTNLEELSEKTDITTLTRSNNKLLGKKVVILQANWLDDPYYQDFIMGIYKYLLLDAWKMEIIGSFGLRLLAEPGDAQKRTEDMQALFDMAVEICNGIK